MPSEATTAAPDAAVPASIATGFVTMLRRLGIDVPVGSALAFFEAVAAVGFDEREPVYWAGRATMIHDPNDFALYEHAFAAFWERLPLWVERPDTAPETITLAVDDDEGLPPDAEQGADDNPVLQLRYSPTEILRKKDFAAYSDAELAEAQGLMQRLELIGGVRSSRRHRPVRRDRGRPDLRRTVRRALRHAGEPIERRFTEPGTRVRRLVFLLDISGSMESYARVLLRFVQAAVVGRRRVEVFTIGTRLTRVTRELTTHDPDRALARAADAVDDWSGGTRLGDALRAFNDEWGQRGMARGATVVVLSDGWDRGDPAITGEQMQRLARVAHRVIWVNPLKATPGYQPLAAGMAAALPHVDRFIEGHCLESLEQLARELTE